MKKETLYFLFATLLAFAISGGCKPSPLPTVTPSTPTPIQPTLSPTPPGKTLLVTSTADSGPGTLRQALLDTQNGDTITFDPAVFPPDAPETITVTSGLPQISQGNLTIDASKAGVILDGSQLPRDAWIPGLEIVSDGNTIRGMQVINFTGTGIVVAFHGRNNTIGGDRTIGAGPIGQGNLSSGNDFGIGVWDFASNNIVTGNLVGTDISGEADFGNRNSGVWVTEGGAKNIIGPDNVIAYNGKCGIEVSDSLSNTLTQNSIHNNGGVGICLLGDGNTALSAPFIADFDLTDGLISGSSCANCTVEIFSDSGDEGAIYEGQTITNDQGVFTFNKGAPFIGPHLTAIATDMDGNTSEFSLTADTVGSLILQRGNDLPMTIFKFKGSRELADNRIGMGHYSPDNPGPPNLNFQAEEIIASGIKRIDIALTENEPPIDWSFSETEFPPEYDRFIDVLIENGIAINHMLHFWDKAGHPGGEGLARPRFQTQEQIDDFLEYVRFVVDHFKGRADYYTIWSEPDNCGQEGLKCILPQDYINLVRQVIPVIREEDPEAKIVSAPNVLFFAREDLFTLLNSDVVKQFDVISWHPIYDVIPNHPFYGNYYHEYPVIIQEIQQTASAYGFAGEYWGTDLQWNSKKDCNLYFPGCEDYIATDPRAQGMAETDLQVAKYYARGIVMQLGMDVGVGLDVHDTRLQWTYPTIRNLNTVMAGNKPLEIPVEIESDATNIMSYSFSLPNGDRLFALWTDGIAVDNDPGVNTTLTFSGSSAQKVVGIDVLNGFEQELITEMENGNLVIRNLLVKDYPIILRLTN